MRFLKLFEVVDIPTIGVMSTNVSHDDEVKLVDDQTNPDDGLRFDIRTRLKTLYYLQHIEKGDELTDAVQREGYDGALQMLLAHQD
eukprot:m.741613 g.741613  ORF g.741613 m.741613 type:complete len:86 (+) comp23116_c3_seq86:1821-2078(+)